MSNGYQPKSAAPAPLRLSPKTPNSPLIPPMAGGLTYRQQLILALAPVIAAPYTNPIACIGEVIEVADALIKAERESA